MTESSDEGRPDTGEDRADASEETRRREQRGELGNMLRATMAGKPFSELYAATFNHRGALLIGDVLLDTLEERGFRLGDFDMVGALTAAAVPMVDAVIHAALRRGAAIDGFVMDFVYPSIKGPSIADRRVVLLDAWLSEKSYVQTSSLVTLRNGNELSLDFSVVKQEHATVVAIASLIGAQTSKPGEPSQIEVIDTVDGDTRQIPSVSVFDESELSH